MELLAKQFSQDSFCGFLIPFAKLLLLITVFYFLQGVNDTRDEKKCQHSIFVQSKSWLEHAHGCLVAGRHGLAHLEADRLVP